MDETRVWPAEGKIDSHFSIEIDPDGLRTGTEPLFDILNFDGMPSRPAMALACGVAYHDLASNTECYKTEPGCHHGTDV